MNFPKFLFTFCIVASIFTCGNNPQNPYSQDKAKVFLHLESSTKIASDSAVTDTAGDTVRIGISYFMPEYFDSVVITVEKTIQDVDTFFVCRKPDIKDDTAWFQCTLKSEGIRTSTATGYVEGGYKPSAIATITVIARPVNHKPVVVVTGLRTITTAVACTLVVSVNDSDTAQAHSFQVLKGPSGYSFANQIFTWKPASPADTGIDSVVLMVADNGVPVMTDTQIVLLTVKGTNQVIDSTDLTGPVFFQKSGPANNAVISTSAIVIVDSIADPSGVDTVSWSLNGTPEGTLKPDSANHYTVNVQLTTYHANGIIIVASDKSTNHNKSADTIALDYNVPPMANDQTLSTKKDTPLPITLTANPVDGDALSNWTIVTQPKNGTLSGTAPNLTYTATTGFIGLDSITVTVSDGVNTSLAAKIKINVSDVLVAPKISNQLNDTSANKGSKAAFSVVINSGANPTPSFTWTKQGQTSAICSTQTFTITQTKYSDQGKYRCVVSNSQGTDSTVWAMLTVTDVTKPVIVLKGSNPQNITLGAPYVELGDSAYDDRDGIITSKVVRDTSKVNIALAGTYKVTYAVKDSSGNIADTATRTVVIGGVAPTISKTSGNQEACIGVQAMFSVTASGTPAPKYQWMKGTAAAPGTSTSSTYAITPGSVADAGNFYCVVSNGIGPDAQTQNMTLTVDSPPVITAPSKDTAITKVAGDSVKMTIAVSGSDTLHYQWYKGTSPLGTTASLTIKPLALADSGSYTCSVTNTCKTTTSKVFTLTVNSTPSITTQPKSQALYLDQSTTFTVVATGKPSPTYSWQKNGAIINGATGASYTISSPGISDSGKYTATVTNSAGSVISDPARFYAVVKSVAAGDNHSLFLKTDGSVFGCGIGNSGQLGDSAGANRSVPSQIMTGVQKISAGGAQSFFLKTDGTLYACGYNGDGELGDGTSNDPLFPILIMTGVQTMSTGESHTLILRTNGTLFACGSNYYGQLGDGTRTDRLSPIQIKTGVKDIAAGGYHSLILMTDGTLLSCGENNLGQLGDTTTKNDSIPVKIMTGVQSIAAGNSHSMILETGGSLFACGNNLFGQLGDGTTNNHTSPEPITTGAQNVAAGGYHSLILMADGTLLACGLNTYGQLGDGTMNQLTAVQVKTAVQSIAAGENHSLILMQDGTVLSCGYNSYGQLGNGTTSDQYTPVKITF